MIERSRSTQSVRPQRQIFQKWQFATKFDCSNPVARERARSLVMALI